MSFIRDKAHLLLDQHKYSEAVLLLLQALDDGEDDENLYYLIGQCYRFINNYAMAIYYLKIAVDMSSSIHNFMALGIVFQLDKQYSQSIKILKLAIEKDPNHLLAYNSLALTYKRIGKYTKAIDLYDTALNIMADHIIMKMNNSQTSKIIEGTYDDKNLWVEYALNTSMRYTIKSNIQSIGFPTGETATREEEEHTNAGLYWKDKTDKDGKITRIFLPNYLNSFREILTDTVTYANFIADRGLILNLMGNEVQGNLHLKEGQLFLTEYNAKVNIEDRWEINS